jgi:hypothetical protein
MKVFKEEQRFTQLWIIVLLAISVIVPVIIIINQYLKEKNSFSTLELVLVISLTILLPLVIFLFKLYTRIDESGIHYRFFPFHFKLKTIAWHEISKVYVRKYDAISEYGGWGLKGGFFWRKSKGIAINVSGDIGIQLELKNGKKILIGTQLENQVKQVLNHYNSKLEHHENNI